MDEPSFLAVRKNTMNHNYIPQIKVCGLTRPDEAAASVDLGADAIGLVFYPKSPRNVTNYQAADITAQLPDHVAAVGVFVNPEMEMLIQAINQCGLHTVQLHGTESPNFVENLKKRTAANVVKALFSARAPGFEQAGRYDVNAYLVECGAGRLPGGNAEGWDWALAEPMVHRYPLILAGGLDPQTVSQAIAASRPDAVDASSGLEAAPGRKDLTKVAQFIRAVQQTADEYKRQGRQPRSIF